MILVIDVGNTNIVIGVYNRTELVYSWRIETNKEITSDDYGAQITEVLRNENLDQKTIKAVVISSVVPPLTNILGNAVRKCFKLEPLIVGPEVKTGIKIKYDNPQELGADRIVNAAAAYEIYGGPVIVVDMGTATKICAISSTGDFLGGVICPGLGISAEALFQRASKLPKVDLVKPANVIGQNTVANMQSGLIYGHADLVDGLVSRVKREMGEQNIKVVATGGLASIIAGISNTIDEFNTTLTLEGLRIIYEKNK